MSKLRWLLVGLGAVLLFRWLRGSSAVRQFATNVRDFDLPSAGLYDALFASLIGGFYRRVAADVAAAHPAGRVLEVGGGPGQLAVELARRAPSLTIVGVDVSPAMVERATRRVMDAGLAGRVQPQVGDVAALPFPDASFDMVLSTLSLHHWPDPDVGLREVYRVLRPGAEAWIYDVPDWLAAKANPRDHGLAHLAAGSPFGGGSVHIVRWPGPVPAFRWLRLQR